MPAIKTSIPRNCFAIVALLVFCTGNIGWAQTDEAQLPMLLDADSTDYDGKSSMLMFRGLRLTQGNIGIQADEGRASKLDFEDSVWHFAGNVVIDVDSGHIECDAADLNFSGNELQLAIITGSPATFELQRPTNDDATYAEAGRLEYDLTTNVVTFSEDATITEGGNQISSAYLVYDIVEQRIKATSGGNGDEKVRITYTPGDVEDAVDDAVDDAGADAELLDVESQLDEESSDSEGDGIP